MEIKSRTFGKITGGEGAILVRINPKSNCRKRRSDFKIMYNLCKYTRMSSVPHELLYGFDHYCVLGQFSYYLMAFSQY